MNHFFQRQYLFPKKLKCNNTFPGEEHLELQLEKLDLGPCIVDAASGSHVIIAQGPWCGGRIE